MNGMAASDKIFRLLDLPEHKQEVSESFPLQHDIVCSGLRFSYEAAGKSCMVWIYGSPRAASRLWLGKAAVENRQRLLF